jgi:hypothetical protein
MSVNHRLKERLFFSYEGSILGYSHGACVLMKALRLVNAKQL